MVLMSFQQSTDESPKANAPSRRSVMGIYAVFALCLLLGAAGVSVAVDEIGVLVLASMLAGLVGCVTWFSYRWCVRVFFPPDRDSV